MSDAENTKEAPLSEEQSVEEAKEAPLLEKKPVEEALGTSLAPKPTATGNEKITILKSSLHKECEEREEVVGVALAIRNVSDTTIASAVFEAVFLDIEGNILDTVEHKTIDLRPNMSRAIIINTSIPERNKVKSYNIKIIRMTTTDVEKVQLRRHEIRTTETGEEEIRGIVKNISEVKTDAALVVTFYDSKKENIGTKGLVLKDIEPNTIRQFDLKFKPQEGDRVGSYSLNIGEIAE